MDSIVYISLTAFVAVIALLVYIRSKACNKYEVKNSGHHTWLIAGNFIPAGVMLPGK
jgi:hypothetical protein